MQTVHVPAIAGLLLLCLASAQAQQTSGNITTTRLQYKTAYKAYEAVYNRAWGMDYELHPDKFQTPDKTSTYDSFPSIGGGGGDAGGGGGCGAGGGCGGGGM